MRYLTLFLVVFLLFFYFVHTVTADPIDDISKQISEITQLLEESRKATAPLEQNLQKVEADVISVESKFRIVTIEIQNKEREIAQGEKDLTKQQEIIDINARIYYKNSRAYINNILGLFLREGISQATRAFLYQQQGMFRNRDIILKTAFFIRSLEEKKQKLEEEKAQLAQLQLSLAKQKEFYNTEVTKAHTYQSGLQSQIAQLVARQQQLIAQKLASLNIPQSAGVGGSCSSDITNGRDPGFSPRFGFFTYGVPNRVGLNQWGAKGRAESGQNAEQILSAYYGNYNLDKGYNSGINIHVVGTNDYSQNIDQTWNIDDYLKHLYEMPATGGSAFPQEALRAQAIAARSYVLASTNNGASSICPSQHCQVVKLEENSDSWKQAVDATKGWVMTSGGSPISAYFSSTHGGYVYDSSAGISNRPWLKNGQDSRASINNFSDLNNNAYDKDSPYFYCDWGSRDQYGKTAWLKSEEVADIVNIVLLTAKDGSLINHLWQTDKPNPYGTDTWDNERVKSELRARDGSPYNSVSDVSVSADFGSGKTTSLSISGDAGNNSIDAAQFKNSFNSRAPANIQIVGLLYNIEKR